MELRYLVTDNKYESINQLLKTEFKISSRLMSKLINNKKVFINNIVCDTRIKPKENDQITIKLNMEEDSSNIQSVKMKLNIIYEDEGILVIDKPAGIAIHPSLRHYYDNLSSGVKYYYEQIGLKKKIRPVNRLDIDTSGIVIFAKNEYIQEHLIRQMKDSTFKKEYLCIVSGILEKKEETIDCPIARKEKSIIERCVRDDGQQAITHYKVINEKDNYSLVKCKIETGRTHQIRVHMAYIGHPILSDSLYGKKSDLINRQALHCYKQSFINPSSNENMMFQSDLPKDMKFAII